ncbi:1-deoxy-D-xylulose-5-phosphate synthase [Acetobacteraceae bacterium]|nr:1-deoxy-D-xylulose-5-phosphate synthase [Acetobacteraceae bacterium]
MSKSSSIPTWGRFPSLDKVTDPSFLRTLSPAELQIIADELRSETIDAVSSTGGHLGASLGVVELTVALHAVFNTPKDRIVWDVGHQTYPHKILTGRRDRIRTLRQPGGLSGFTRRVESEYDPFGAAHSSTSISAALGMTVAHKLLAKTSENAEEDYGKRNTVAVIGDGSISAGMAYEALNNAGACEDDANQLIVILNDNEMSIAPPVGAMSNYLTQLISSTPYFTLRDLGSRIAKRLPGPIERTAKKAEEYARGLLAGGTLFEELGFYYVGPVNGHDMSQLVPILKNLRDSKKRGPILLHVVTEKGRGYAPAEEAGDKYHAVGKFDIETGVIQKPTKTVPNYTELFTKELLALAEEDSKVVAVTAAMPAGTGLTEFSKKFPDRCFDVGIAEQHAVTFSAGMATEGLKPFCCIYSTFLQRAFDQVMHDVALQSLPVRLMVDRAGLVGADGATHAGSFDLNYLCCLPNMIVMAPSDEAELFHMVKTAWSVDTQPTAVRYPRGAAQGVSIPEKAEILPIGKGRITSGETEKDGVAILSLGSKLHEAEKAAETLRALNIPVTVADARFAKPVDQELVKSLAEKHKVFITIEEGAAGGFSAQVLPHLCEEGLLDRLAFRPVNFPDKFIDHNTPEKQYEEAGITAKNIADVAQKAFNAKSENNA